MSMNPVNPGRSRDRENGTPVVWIVGAIAALVLLGFAIWASGPTNVATDSTVPQTTGQGTPPPTNRKGPQTTGQDTLPPISPANPNLPAR